MAEVSTVEIVADIPAPQVHTYVRENPGPFGRAFCNHVTYVLNFKEVLLLTIFFNVYL